MWKLFSHQHGADTSLCVGLVIAMNNLIKPSIWHLLPLGIDLSQMLK